MLLVRGNHVLELGVVLLGVHRGVFVELVFIILYRTIHDEFAHLMVRFYFAFKGCAEVQSCMTARIRTRIVKG